MKQFERFEIHINPLLEKAVLCQLTHLTNPETGPKIERDTEVILVQSQLTAVSRT